METLNNYTYEEQTYIINIGKIVYDYNKKNQIHKPCENVNVDYVIEKVLTFI